MSNDYMPQTDEEFDSWQANANAQFTANISLIGLPLSDLAPVTAATGPWNTKFPAAGVAVTAAQVAVADKNSAKKTLMDAWRALVRKIQAQPNVPDAVKVAMRITVPDKVKSGPKAVVNRPGLHGEIGNLLHEIEFYPEGGEIGDAKEEGMVGCEIRYAVTAAGAAAPTDPDSYVTLGVDSDTPYTKKWKGPDVGKTAHYVGRWVNSFNIDVQTGEFTAPISLTISQK